MSVLASGFRKHNHDDLNTEGTPNELLNTKNRYLAEFSHILANFPSLTKAWHSSFKTRIHSSINNWLRLELS